MKEIGEMRLGTGTEITLGRKRDTSSCQVSRKEIRTVLLSIKGRIKGNGGHPWL